MSGRHPHLIEDVVAYADGLLASGTEIVTLHADQLQTLVDRLRWLEREFGANQDRLNRELIDQQAIVARAHQMIDMFLEEPHYEPSAIKKTFEEWVVEYVGDGKGISRTPLEWKVMKLIVALRESLTRCGEETP